MKDQHMPAMAAVIPWHTLNRQKTKTATLLWLYASGMTAAAVAEYWNTAHPDDTITEGYVPQLKQRHKESFEAMQGQPWPLIFQGQLRGLESIVLQRISDTLSRLRGESVSDASKLGNLLATIHRVRAEMEEGGQITAQDRQNLAGIADRISAASSKKRIKAARDGGAPDNR